jgi:drug/metabolite transporter (DMT)-like permease
VSGIALSLVLVAAVIHAGWNRMLHGATDRLAAAAVGSAMGAVILSPALVASPPARVWPLALASGAAEAAYFGFLSAAYRRGELSFTYPVARGIAPFFITIGGALVLAQPLGPARVLGSLALGAGLVVISRAGLAAGRGIALAFAGLTGLSIATYSVIDARAVRSASPIGYLAAITSVQAVLLLGAVLAGAARPARARGLTEPGRSVAGQQNKAPEENEGCEQPGVCGQDEPRDQPGVCEGNEGRGRLGVRGQLEERGQPGVARRSWRRLRAAARAGAGVGIGSLAAYLLVLFAFQRAAAAPVATLRELSILFGILLARERPGWRVWLGGALCVTGAALAVL